MTFKIPTIFDINHTPDNILTFLEAHDIGFVPHRIYYLKNLDYNSKRGFHAHKRLKQVMIATSGKFEIELEGKHKTHSFKLDNPNKAIYIPSGYYRTLKNFSKDTTCLVLASDKYDEKDYIRDYKEFKKWEEHKARISKVDYIPLHREQDFLEPKISIAIKKALQSNQLILGPSVKKFEEEFAKYCGTKYAIGVANGLDALRLILKAMNISQGDEIIIPSHTFIATALAIQDVGAKPVFVDIDMNTYNIKPELIEAAITKHTKAIMPVHMHGLPCDMVEINKIAKNHKLKVIEDSAQAHGASVKEERCGTLSDAAAFSLYPTKNLGCYGDGGIITTSDKILADKLCSLRNYGSKERYKHELPGVNSRLDEIQAAALLVKLPYLDSWNQRRTEIAKQYREGLKNNKDIILPSVPDNMQHVYHHFVIRLKNKKQRNSLQEYLTTHNIVTVIHYPTPLHQETIFLSAQKCPNTETVSDTALSLPMSPFLMDKEIQYVITKITGFITKNL